MTKRPRLHPNHHHQWAEHDFEEDVDDCSMCVCGVPALTHDQVYAHLVRCEICDLEMPRTVVEAYDLKPIDGITVIGEPGFVDDDVQESKVYDRAPVTDKGVAT